MPLNSLSELQAALFSSDTDISGRIELLFSLLQATASAYLPGISNLVFKSLNEILLFSADNPEQLSDLDRRQLDVSLRLVMDRWEEEFPISPIGPNLLKSCINGAVQFDTAVAALQLMSVSCQTRLLQSLIADVRGNAADQRNISVSKQTIAKILLGPKATELPPALLADSIFAASGEPIADVNAYGSLFDPSTACGAAALANLLISPYLTLDKQLRKEFSAIRQALSVSSQKLKQHDSVFSDNTVFYEGIIAYELSTLPQGSAIPNAVIELVHAVIRCKETGNREFLYLAALLRAAESVGFFRGLGTVSVQRRDSMGQDLTLTIACSPVGPVIASITPQSTTSILPKLIIEALKGVDPARVRGSRSTLASWMRSSSQAQGVNNMLMEWVQAQPTLVNDLFESLEAAAAADGLTPLSEFLFSSNVSISMPSLVQTVKDLPAVPWGPLVACISSVSSSSQQYPLFSEAMRELGPLIPASPTPAMQVEVTLLHLGALTVWRPFSQGRDRDAWWMKPVDVAAIAASLASYGTPRAILALIHCARYAALENRQALPPALAQLQQFITPDMCAQWFLHLMEPNFLRAVAGIQPSFAAALCTAFIHRFLRERTTEFRGVFVRLLRSKVLRSSILAMSRVEGDVARTLLDSFSPEYLSSVFKSKQRMQLVVAAGEQANLTHVIELLKHKKCRKEALAVFLASPRATAHAQDFLTSAPAKVFRKLPDSLPLGLQAALISRLWSMRDTVKDFPVSITDSLSHSYLKVIFSAYIRCVGRTDEIQSEDLSESIVNSLQDRVAVHLLPEALQAFSEAVSYLLTEVPELRTCVQPDLVFTAALTNRESPVAMACFVKLYRAMGGPKARLEDALTRGDWDLAIASLTALCVEDVQESINYLRTLISNAPHQAPRALHAFADGIGNARLEQSHISQLSGIIGSHSQLLADDFTPGASTQTICDWMTAINLVIAGRQVLFSKIAGAFLNGICAIPAAVLTQYPKLISKRNGPREQREDTVSQLLVPVLEAVAGTVPRFFANSIVSSFTRSLSPLLIVKLMSAFVASGGIHPNMSYYFDRIMFSLFGSLLRPQFEKISELAPVQVVEAFRLLLHRYHTEYKRVGTLDGNI